MTPSKSLILITNHFPFGKGESFLESEIKYLCENFADVIILSRNTESNELRSLNDRVKYHRLSKKSNLGEIIFTSFYCFSRAKTFITLIADEIRFLKHRGKKVSYPIMRTMCHDLFKGFATSIHLKKIIRQHSLSGSVILYSYWLNSSALAVALTHVPGLQIRRIARGHGSDIYEDLHPNSYLSFRKTLSEKLNAIFTISTFGANYLKSLHASFPKTVRISRLGTFYVSASPVKQAKEVIIVSCSFISPLKRIHLIIEALALVKMQVPIHWIHIGDGALRNELESLANEKLSAGKVRHTFMGNLANQQLLHFYAENYVDLFLSTSASEGVPVSMMEAQSFGIPIVSSDVGGTSEIVTSDNGRLFPKDATPGQIASIIEEVLSLPSENYGKLREHAFKNWETHYNAERNYSTFVREIQLLA